MTRRTRFAFPALAAALMAAAWVLNWGSVGPYPGVRRARAADDYADLRESMVREQILARGVSDRNVLAALRGVPRHRFVPPPIVWQAYNDHPLPIGNGQTISQPYIVAFMSDLLDLRKAHNRKGAPRHHTPPRSSSSGAKYDSRKSS